MERSYFAYIVVVILFIIGILMLTLVNPFGEYWVTGLGILSASIVGIVITVYYKTRP